MQKSVFATECDIIRLYFENAEANVVNDLYFETADDASFGDKVAEIGKKVVNKINEIIQSIKDFFEQIRRKHESAKIAAMLKSECARSNALIKANVRDKEIMKQVSQVFKLEQRGFVELRKAYDQFMAHKIDYATYCQKSEKIQNDFDDALEKVYRNADNSKLINVNTAFGQYKLSELTKHVSEVDSAYNKVLDKMRDDVIKEEENIKAAARKAAVDNVTSSATAKVSAALSKMNKKAVSKIIQIVGIAAAAGFCYRAGQKKASLKVESAEDDYFSDILGESDTAYQEDAEDDNIFADILGV